MEKTFVYTIRVIKVGAVAMMAILVRIITNHPEGIFEEAMRKAVREIALAHLRIADETERR